MRRALRPVFPCDAAVIDYPPPSELLKPDRVLELATLVDDDGVVVCRDYMLPALRDELEVQVEIPSDVRLRSKQAASRSASRMTSEGKAEGMRTPLRLRASSPNPSTRGGGRRTLTVSVAMQARQHEI